MAWWRAVHVEVMSQVNYVGEVGVAVAIEIGHKTTRGVFKIEVEVYQEREVVLGNYAVVVGVAANQVAPQVNMG